MMTRTRASRVLAWISLAATVACSSDSATSPAAMHAGDLRVAPAGVAVPWICGTDVPITVSVTTERQGRAIPAPNFLVNFHATDGMSTIFAGAAMTNTSGVASDVLHLHGSPGRLATVEVRSVAAATGAPTTHLELKNFVLMSPSAAISEPIWLDLSDDYVIFLAQVGTGCPHDPADPYSGHLPLETPWKVTRVSTGETLVSSSISGYESVVEGGMFAKKGEAVTLTVGSVRTGFVSRTFTIPNP